MKSTFYSCAILAYASLMLACSGQDPIFQDKPERIAKTVGCHSKTTGDLVVTKRKVDRLEALAENKGYYITDFDGGASTIFNVDCKVTSQIVLASK